MKPIWRAKPNLSRMLELSAQIAVGNCESPGVWITDVENNQYLDCLAGAGTLALDIITPTSCKASKMSLPAACRYILDLTTPLKIVSPITCSLLPGEGKAYCLQFCGPSGADAVEAALKLAKSTPAVPA